MGNRRFRYFFVISVVIGALLVGYGFYQIESQQSKQKTLIYQELVDRETAVLANVAARKSDCENNNQIRTALRENIEQSKREIPILLKLVPSVDTKRIITLTEKSDARQLKSFVPVDCTAYALKAAPKYEQKKLTVQEQQAELKATQAEIQSVVTKSAEARVITVGQRCNLTGLIEQVLVKQDPKMAPAFVRSYKACEKQLGEVKKIAEQARR